MHIESSYQSGQDLAPPALECILITDNRLDLVCRHPGEMIGWHVSNGMSDSEEFARRSHMAQNLAGKPN